MRRRDTLTALVVLASSLCVGASCTESRPRVKSAEEIRYEQVLARSMPLTRYHRTLEGERVFPFTILEGNLGRYVENVCFVDSREIFGPYARAVAYPEKRTIVLDSDASDREAFHEAAHVYHAVLDAQGSSFTWRWKRELNVPYEENSLRNQLLEDECALASLAYLADAPGIGCTRRYGMTNVREHVATTVEVLGYEIEPEHVRMCIERGLGPVNMQLYDGRVILGPQYSGYARARQQFAAHGFVREFPAYFADPKDHRYQTSIQLLREFGFLNPRQCRRLMSRIGALGAYAQLLKQDL